MKPSELTWIELDQKALQNNISLFRERIGHSKKLLVPVKGNAYGHGLEQMAPAFIDAGVDWLGVHSLEEALRVRAVGVDAPVLILGYVPFQMLPDAVEHGFRLMLSSLETAKALSDEATKQKKIVPVHIKLETGTYRQGVEGSALLELARFVVTSPHLRLESCYTHFANIEDTTDHRFALSQLSRFNESLDMLKEQGLQPEWMHSASSAATMLFDETHFQMVRAGIAAYGLWPSRETYVSLLEGGKSRMPIKPILSWKTIIAQIKKVPAGSYIGYGCSYRTMRDIDVAILPLGYYDGVDRGLSNMGHVLIRGRRAPIRGRICMNLIMVDVTDIPGVRQEDEVILLGEQGDDKVTADMMASMISTIHYEVVTRISQHVPRRWA